MLSNTHFAMAVHVLSALAHNAGKVVGSNDLAETVGTNPSFLRGLIGQLRDAGLVETRLGKGGGTLLARSAAQITLHDVYRATEAGPALTTHKCEDQRACVVAQAMVQMLAEVNERLETAIAVELQAMTVEDLLSAHVVRD